MVSARPVYRPPLAPKSHRLPARVYWRRRAIALLGAITLVVVGYLGISLAFALHNPSYGVSYSARGAEWGRQHGIGGLVTWIETEYYKLNPPKVGSKPTGQSFGSGATQVSIPPGVHHLAAPAPLISPAAHPLPGEGVWHVAGRETATGVPTMYEAFVRPNAINTSYVVGVAWMDTTLLKAQLYSGSIIPGNGPFKYSAPITAKNSENLVTAFNAGFRMQDANGGYYTDGRMVLPLRKGAASVVIFRDGTMTVGMWGRELKMNNQIASVRQNLDLIVDHGAAVPGLASQNSVKWGKTLGGTFNVWRSGLGVTKSGAIIYVGGPSLSISDLANVLVRAGAIRGMELDINTDWVQFSAYTGALNTPINGGNGSCNGGNATCLLSSMNGPPSRYFTTWWNRDFFTMTLRAGQTTAALTTTTTAASG